MTFDKLKVVIVGDIMLDHYSYGQVSRISPEAPVPILDFLRADDRLGGAANVALNIKALGAEPILIGTIGNDEQASTIKKLLHQANISTDYLIQGLNKDRVTTLKHRIIAQNHQILRIDTEFNEPLNPDETDLLLTLYQKAINQKVDAVILQDYNKGVLFPLSIEQLIKTALENKIFVAVDPKKHNFFHYKNVNLFKPNAKEAAEGLNITFDTTLHTDYEKVTKAINQKLNAEHVLLTLGEHGLFMLFDNQTHYNPATKQAIVDVSGAGDTVISLCTLALCSGMTIDDALKLANIGAGLVCQQPGVTSVDPKILWQTFFKD